MNATTWIAITTAGLAVLAPGPANAQLLPLAEQTADVMTQELLNQMKAAGIPCGRADIMNMERAMRHQQSLVELHNRLTIAARAYRSNNNEAGAKAAEKELRAVDELRKAIPQPPTEDEIKRSKGNAPRYFELVASYTKLRAQGVQERIAATVEKTERLEKGESVAGGEAGARETAARDAYQALVSVQAVSDPGAKSGGFDVYVDGVKIERPGQAVPVRRSTPFVVKVVGVDARRAFIRNFVEPPNTTKDSADDYGLTYSTRSGDFRGSTRWVMSSESYAWNVAVRGGDAAHVAKSSGLKPGLSNDLLEVKFERPFKAQLDVGMTSEWKSTSQRPGGTRTSSENGSSKATIQLDVLPR